MGSFPHRPRFVAPRTRCIPAPRAAGIGDVEGCRAVVVVTSPLDVRSLTAICKIAAAPTAAARSVRGGAIKLAPRCSGLDSAHCDKGGDMGRKLVAELLGTALLVFFAVGVATLSFGFGTTGTSFAAGVVATALAFGLTLMALAYTLGPISGCHVNPAVTIGALLAGRITPVEAVGYWVAQFVGGILGALLLWATLDASPLYSQGEDRARGRRVGRRQPHSHQRRRGVPRRSGADGHVRLRHPRRDEHDRQRGHGGCGDRPDPHRGPPDRHPHHRNVGESGAQPRPRSSSAGRRCTRCGSSSWRRWSGEPPLPGSICSSTRRRPPKRADRGARMQNRADRRVALVTGASRGIGRASALALGDAGLDVALTARTLLQAEVVVDPVAEGSGVGAGPGIGSLESTAHEIEERGGRALAVRADLLDRVSLLGVVERVLGEWGVSTCS